MLLFGPRKTRFSDVRQLSDRQATFVGQATEKALQGNFRALATPATALCAVAL
jgi:hypothetical protein